ncbi:fused DSP-PTPase phosphatase/NAD kinase-like protein [Clostridium disporicum]|uniref:fused DSP-PTPase phosphatase/NAD kinase-like protein n=1 Tax=Clostridium disporicum TaxID=84024 RepID=UPI0036158608
MKQFILKSFIFISLAFLSFNLLSASPFSSIYNNNNSQTLVVRDSTSKTGLPDRFRDIPNLNFSGSAQFTSEQVENLKNAINKPNICIIDLRQESHGLVNDYAISFFNPNKDLNNGFTTEETIKTENNLLSKIKIGEPLSIYRKTGILFKEMTVDFVSNESSAVTKAGMEYKRYAVKDNGAPTPEIVNQFVEFIKSKPSDLHLHFHCDAGEGRTTTFMSMYQILMNNTNLSLEQIISYQYNVGGVNLHDNKHQFEFLEDFYRYVSENKSNNYTTSYSEWIKQA